MKAIFSQHRSNFLTLVLVTGLLLFFSMDLSAQFSDTVKVFAHRGGKLEFDENTISAFEGSYKRGLRGFETDIRLTKDNQLVIFHDGDLKRIFGRDGSIESLSLKELKELRTEAGHQIPTLDELLAFLNTKPGLYVEFELKTKTYQPAVIEKYVDAIYQKVFKDRPANSDYLLTSFDTRPLQYIKARYPEVPLLLIKSEGLSQKVLDEAKSLQINRVGCRVEGTNRSIVEKAKQQGFIVSLWPGTSVHDFLLGLALGSDYLCTDVPVTVYDWVKQYGSWIYLK